MASPNHCKIQKIKGIWSVQPPSALYFWTYDFGIRVLPTNSKERRLSRKTTQITRGGIKSGEIIQTAKPKGQCHCKVEPGILP
jgi:hypothetical protein